jgi:hypothetical protein
MGLVYLKGRVLIIPVYFGLFILGYYINTQKSNKILNLAFSIPFTHYSPFIQMFPVGLGGTFFGSAILTVLTTVLLLPILALSEKKEHGR